jgi:hypothetical protein
MDANEVGNRQAARRNGRGLFGAAVLAAALLGVCKLALAQGTESESEYTDEDDAQTDVLSDTTPEDAMPGAGDAGNEAESDDAAETQGTAQAAGAEEPTAQADASDRPKGPPDPEQKNGFVAPESESDLSFSGGLELDTGYAQYTFESDALHDEDVYDFRGRFVLGPTLAHEFWQDWFVKARGEAVLWVREQLGVYQVNVDDVFAQVGKQNVWDFKLGRFRTWRVYHKGLGFDLFTLEDAGACVQNPCSADAGTFGPHTYEVNFIYDRETPGHAAFHLYPTEWSGIELAAAYGQGGVSNTWGVRGAAMIHFDFLRVMGAAELRKARPREESSSTDSMGNVVDCDKCGFSQRFGFGGGVEITHSPIEVGFNIARGATDIYTVTTGAFDEGGSNDTTSLGGYAELDVGSFTFERSLIVGFGLNRTEALAINESFRQHTQYAAYIAYPLGFNAAMVKLVLSRADLESLTLVDPMNRVFNKSESAMSAARVRLAYPF